MRTRIPHPDQWILPLFFLANAIVTGWILDLLEVKTPLYLTLPYIFAVAFCLVLIPTVRQRIATGPPSWRLIPPLLYAVVISLASSVHPVGTTGVEANFFHPVEFAGLAFLAQLAAHGGLIPRPRQRLLLAVALACVAFGVADELHQSFVPRRVTSATDVGLDAFGIAAGTLVYLAAHRLTSALFPRKS